MDIISYYRALGAGESSPHGLEREFYSATVSSVMEKQRDNSNICFHVGELPCNNGYKSDRMKRKQINELTIVNNS